MSSNCFSFSSSIPCGLRPSTPLADCRAPDSLDCSPKWKFMSSPLTVDIRQAACLIRRRNFTTASVVIKREWRAINYSYNFDDLHVTKPSYVSACTLFWPSWKPGVYQHRQTHNSFTVQRRRSLKIDELDKSQNGQHVWFTYNCLIVLASPLVV